MQYNTKNKVKYLFEYVISNFYLFLVYPVILVMLSEPLTNIEIIYIFLSIVITLLGTIFRLKLFGLISYPELLTVKIVSFNNTMLSINIIAIVLNLFSILYSVFIQYNFNYFIVVTNFFMLISVYILKSNVLRLNTLEYSKKKMIKYGSIDAFDYSIGLKSIVVDSRNMLFSQGLRIVSKNVNRSLQNIEGIVGYFELHDKQVEQVLKLHANNLIMLDGKVDIHGKNHVSYTYFDNSRIDFLLCDINGAVKILGKTVALIKSNPGVDSVYIIGKIGSQKAFLAFKYDLKYRFDFDVLKHIIIKATRHIEVSFTNNKFSNAPLLKLEQKVVGDEIDSFNNTIAGISYKNNFLVTQIGNISNAIIISGNIKDTSRSFLQTININNAINAIQQLLFFRIIFVQLVVLAVISIIIPDAITENNIMTVQVYTIFILFVVSLFVINSRFEKYTQIEVLKMTLLRSIIKITILLFMYLYMYSINYDLSSCWFALYSLLIILNGFDIRTIYINSSKLAKMYALIVNLLVVIVFMAFAYISASDEFHFEITSDMFGLILGLTLLYVFIIQKHIDKLYNKLFSK